MADDSASDAPLFTRLPNELLDAVTSHLDKASLCSFALTSKRMIASATDALYMQYNNSDPPSVAPFALFLCTLCDRLDLAAKVKMVHIRGAAWRVDTVPKNEKATTKVLKEGGDPLSSSDNFTKFVEAAVKAKMMEKRESYPVTPLKDHTKWYTTLRTERDFVRLLGHGVEDAHVLLMLALLLQLQSLIVDALPPYPTLDWHLFFSRTGTALRSLRYLALFGTCTTARGPSVGINLGILDMLPDLQEVHMIDLNVAFDKKGAKVFLSKNIESVTFTNCAIDLNSLKKVLVNQQLNAFRYGPGVGPKRFKTEDYFSADSLSELLTSSR
ncbi:hypothetical protein CC86DRAFT_417150 [Ophiobolus disseminans]|uniref:F-box domain-containing protein n=1 Tax=Ophiobolus disseminans TaxID=1469910 RepID=A0A6A7A037_9PLEO|nr:hypothetical protein CC86DRAFT_417150 [Ophiobolus disseminans]